MIQNAPETPRFRQLEFTVHQQPPDTHSANSVYVLFTVLESTELQLSSRHAIMPHKSLSQTPSLSIDSSPL